MRVGGRLQKANLSTSSTHPVILSVKSRIICLLVVMTHELALHARPSTVMAIHAGSYYIPSLKRLLKKVSRQCVSCQKAYARTSEQMMGELPAARTRPARPFSITGIDFVGPFYYKEGNRRKPITTKCYICVYVCFVTKATFFDVVADLFTEAFLASLRCFTALYGLPHNIYSDNGTNFVGASSELQRLQEVLEANESKEQISVTGQLVKELAGTFHQVVHHILAAYGRQRSVP